MRILLAVAVLIAGCGDPTEPELIPPPERPLTDVSVAGKWLAYQVEVFYNVTFDLTEHSPDSITGKWAGFTPCADFIGGASPNCNPRSGFVTSGKRNGEAITFTMDGGNLGCGYGQAISVTRSGDTATGTTRAVWCDGGSHPTYSMPVTLKKQ